MLNIELYNVYDLLNPDKIRASFPTLKEAFIYCERYWISEYRITNSKGEIIARHEKINKQNHVMNAVWEIMRHCRKCKSCDECIYHYTEHIHMFDNDFDEIHCPFCTLSDLSIKPKEWNCGALCITLREKNLFANWR